MSDTILGYRRADGRFGIRNKVLVISLVQCSNSTAIKIAARCGVPYIGIETGCGEFEERAGRTNLGFITAGMSPNVYGVLLVSLGCQWTDPEEIRRAVETAGKKVHHVCVQDEDGVANAIRKGVAYVEEMKAEAQEQKREPFPVSGLSVGVYCGGSDWTSSICGNLAIGKMAEILEQKGGIILSGEGLGTAGSEGTVAMQAADYEVGRRLIEMVQEICEDTYRSTGQRVHEVNPTPGNKKGGVTTLREKSMGSIKLSGNTIIRGIIYPGDVPRESGNWVIDQRQGANDAYAVTTLAMCGAHIIAFCTGRGTPLGCATSPVIKTTGNPETYARMGGEMIDFSSGGVITGEKTIEQCAGELYQLMLDTANGKPTKAELLEDDTWCIPHGNSFNGEYHYDCKGAKE